MEFTPDIRDISITGKVVNSKSQEPIPNVQVYASVLHKAFQVHATKTNSDGKFIFSFPHLDGDHDIFHFRFKCHAEIFKLQEDLCFKWDSKPFTLVFCRFHVFSNIWLLLNIIINFSYFASSVLQVNYFRFFPALFCHCWSEEIDTEQYILNCQEQARLK